MKHLAILFIYLALVPSILSGFSYVHKWKVVQGCQGSCCCPKKGSSLEIAEVEGEFMTMKIKRGSWEGCSRYGWSKKSTVPLPWDDRTVMDWISGSSIQYFDEAGNPVTWIWYPIITSSGLEYESVKKNDPVAKLAYIDDKGAKCNFIISYNLDPPLPVWAWALILIGGLLALVLIFLFCWNCSPAFSRRLSNALSRIKNFSAKSSLSSKSHKSSGSSLKETPRENLATEAEGLDQAYETPTSRESNSPDKVVKEKIVINK